MVKVTVRSPERNGEAVAGAHAELVGEGLGDDGAVLAGKRAQDGVAIFAGQEAQAAIAADDVEIAGAERGAFAAEVEFQGVKQVDGRDPGDGRRESPGPPAAAADTRPRRPAPPGRTYRSARSCVSSQSATVSRKLPTMIPTLAIMAMAVASAPTTTDVRESEAARLRPASRLSTRRATSGARGAIDRQHQRRRGQGGATRYRAAPQTYPPTG